MPSNAFANFFRVNTLDINRTIQDYKFLSENKYNGRGRRALDHISRGGILLLCAAWEVYIEEVLLECAELIVDECDSPLELPRHVKTKLINFLKTRDDPTILLHVANDGWKSILLGLIEEKAAGLNTPNNHNINELFKMFIGIDNLTNDWTSPNVINEFVEFRGGIAHTGVPDDEDYVKIDKLEHYFHEVKTKVIETDFILMFYLWKVNDRKPWNDTYRRYVQPRP